MRSSRLLMCAIILGMLPISAVSAELPPQTERPPAGVAAPSGSPSAPVALGLLGEAGALLLERGAVVSPDRPDGLPGDRLLLEIAGTEKPLVLFEAPGRVIEDAIVGNLDAKGEPEIVLLLDSCGSGGYRDVVVLARDEKEYRTIHEEGGFTGGRIILADRADGAGTDLVISHVAGFGASAAFPRWQMKVLAMEGDRMVERRETPPGGARK